MIINKPGAEFLHNGIVYCVGDRIIGTDESEYAGLNGSILEIRDGEDKDTENETPDIYCSFDEPVLPRDIEALEETFSDLYDEPKHIEDICLDLVIMAPSMIQVAEQAPMSMKVYVLTENWACESGSGQSTRIYVSLFEAKAHLNRLLADEINSGCISDWIGRTDYKTETTDLSYEGWIDGCHCEFHYIISIEEQELNLSVPAMGEVGRAYMRDCQLEDLVSQISDWDELEQLTDEQYERLICDSSFPDRFNSAIGKNDCYWEAYWQTLSEVARELVKEYLHEKNSLSIAGREEDDKSVCKND